MGSGLASVAQQRPPAISRQAKRSAHIKHEFTAIPVNENRPMS
jgi:hypothetical protein